MINKSVAILLSTFNGEEYISEFLDSLVAQSFKNFSLIVRDDKSSDSTLSILKRYSSFLSISYITSQGNIGPAKSFMELVDNAGADFDYYFFADQDDFWFANKIELAINAMNEVIDEPILYCSALELVNKDLKHLSFSAAPKFISLNNALVENIATGCTVAFNGEARALILNHSPQILIMHDWWFYIVISAFGVVLYDRNPTIKYRQHGGNAVGAAASGWEDIKRKYHRFFVRRNDDFFRISDQALEFQRCYQNVLSTSQAKLVKKLAERKSSIFHRIIIAINPGLRRQKNFDNLILRLLFIIGRY